MPKPCRFCTYTDRQSLEESLLKQAITQQQAADILGVKSGFRISELLSLRVSDIYASGKIVDRVYVPRRSMKGKREGRDVPLHPEAKEVLSDWLQELHSMGQVKSQTYVFQSRKGSNKHISPVQAWRILDTAARANGLSGPIGTQSMRRLSLTGSIPG